MLTMRHRRRRSGPFSPAVDPGAGTPVPTVPNGNPFLRFSGGFDTNAVAYLPGSGWAALVDVAGPYVQPLGSAEWRLARDVRENADRFGCGVTGTDTPGELWLLTGNGSGLGKLKHSANMGIDWTDEVTNLDVQANKPQPRPRSVGRDMVRVDTDGAVVVGTFDGPWLYEPGVGESAIFPGTMAGTDVHGLAIVGTSLVVVGYNAATALASTLGVWVIEDFRTTPGLLTLSGDAGDIIAGESVCPAPAGSSAMAYIAANAAGTFRLDPDGTVTNLIPPSDGARAPALDANSDPYVTFQAAVCAERSGGVDYVFSFPIDPPSGADWVQRITDAESGTPTVEGITGGTITQHPDAEWVASGIRMGGTGSSDAGLSGVKAADIGNGRIRCADVGGLYESTNYLAADPADVEWVGIDEGYIGTSPAGLDYSSYDLVAVYADQDIVTLANNSAGPAQYHSISGSNDGRSVSCWDDLRVCGMDGKIVYLLKAAAAVQGDTWVDAGLVTPEVVEGIQLVELRPKPNRRLRCFAVLSDGTITFADFEGDVWSPWTTPIDPVGLASQAIERNITTSSAAWRDCVWFYIRNVGVIRCRVASAEAPVWDSWAATFGPCESEVRRGHLAYHPVRHTLLVSNDSNTWEVADPLTENWTPAVVRAGDAGPLAPEYGTDGVFLTVEQSGSTKAQYLHSDGDLSVWEDRADVGYQIAAPLATDAAMGANGLVWATQGTGVRRRDTQWIGPPSAPFVAQEVWEGPGDRDGLPETGAYDGYMAGTAVFVTLKALWPDATGAFDPVVLLDELVAPINTNTLAGRANRPTILWNGQVSEHDRDLATNPGFATPAALLDEIGWVRWYESEYKGGDITLDLAGGPTRVAEQYVNPVSGLREGGWYALPMLWAREPGPGEYLMAKAARRFVAQIRATMVSNHNSQTVSLARILDELDIGGTMSDFYPEPETFGSSEDFSVTLGEAVSAGAGQTVAIYGHKLGVAAGMRFLDGDLLIEVDEDGLASDATMVCTATGTGTAAADTVLTGKANGHILTKGYTPEDHQAAKLAVMSEYVPLWVEDGVLCCWSTNGCQLWVELGDGTWASRTWTTENNAGDYDDPETAIGTAGIRNGFIARFGAGGRFGNDSLDGDNYTDTDPYARNTQAVQEGRMRPPFYQTRSTARTNATPGDNLSSPIYARVSVEDLACDGIELPDQYSDAGKDTTLTPAQVASARRGNILRTRWLLNTNGGTWAKRWDPTRGESIEMVAPTNADQSYHRWDTKRTTHYLAGDFYLASDPGAFVLLLQLREGGTRVAGVGFSGGAIRSYYQGASGGIIKAAPLQVGSWFRLEADVVRATGVGGSITTRVYADPDDETPVATQVVTGIPTSLGSATAEVRIGLGAPTLAVPSLHVRNPQEN